MINHKPLSLLFKEKTGVMPSLEAAASERGGIYWTEVCRKT